MDYWNEPVFENRLRFEDNKGKVWDSEDLDELPSWEIEELGLHVAEN